jgi:hypothetical protein
MTMSGFCGNPDCSGECATGWCGADDCTGDCAPESSVRSVTAGGDPRKWRVTAAGDPRKCPGCGATRMHERESCLCGYRYRATITPGEAYQVLAEKV